MRVQSYNAYLIIMLRTTKIWRERVVNYFFHGAQMDVGALIRFSVSHFYSDNTQKHYGLFKMKSGYTRVEGTLNLHMIEHRF